MCPLKYRFRYVDGLPEEIVSSSLVFGSAIHAALEFFFSQQMAGEELPDLDMLLSVYQTNWQNRAEANVQFGKKETADSLHELAGRMLKAFLESDLTQQEGRIIGVEEELRGELSPEILDPPCDVLALSTSPQGVKNFLKGPLRYYSGLFNKLHQYGNDSELPVPECYYSSELNRMDGHIMLTLAACGLDDPDEDTKIRAVARGFDRAYVMLQLNRCYDSNQFQELLYTLHPLLRECPADEIEEQINKTILEEINTRRHTDAKSLLSYGQFKQVGYGDFNTRFLRYFLARIEEHIAKGIQCELSDTLYNYVSGTGRGNAYHVEHILARNDESRDLFMDEEGEFDEVMFENERNRFGGLLLLKGKDNISSNNEMYAHKLRTYTGSAPYLAQALVEDFYKSNSAMKEFQERSGFKFVAEPEFSRDALERRSELLYEIAKEIWQV
jgi:hypothetical protein